MTARAFLLADGQRYRHQHGAWQNDYPLTELADWLRHYRDLDRRRPGSAFADDVAALEAVETRARQRGLIPSKEAVA